MEALDKYLQDTNGRWERPAACNLANCPEVRAVGGRVEVRDSARRAEIAWFKTADFALLVQAAKNGEYDHIVGAA